MNRFGLFYQQTVLIIANKIRYTSKHFQQHFSHVCFLPHMSLNSRCFPLKNPSINKCETCLMSSSASLVFCFSGFLCPCDRLPLEQKGLGGQVKPEEGLGFQPHLQRLYPLPMHFFVMLVGSLGSCESLRCSSARCLPPPVKALSHNITTGKGQNAASANCYFKGKGNRPLLAPTMVHIFSQ